MYIYVLPETIPCNNSVYSIQEVYPGSPDILHGIPAFTDFLAAVYLYFNAAGSTETRLNGAKTFYRVFEIGALIISRKF